MKAWMDNNWQWLIQIGIIPILLMWANALIKNYRERGKRILDKDQKLFESFMKKFPSSHVGIIYISDQKHSNQIPEQYPFRLMDIKRFLEMPETEFSNKNMEKKKQELLKTIIDFNLILTPNIFVDNHDSDYFVIKYRDESKRGDHEATKEFNELAKTLDSMVDDIFEAYVDFMKSGRKL